MNVKDFKKGFKYKVWIGYKWVVCTYPDTGFFGTDQIKMAIDKGIVKPVKP